jgi:hypothetical protein
MDQSGSYGGKYDDLLISHAKAIKEAGQTPSNTRLVRALQNAARVSPLEARRVVDDFSERGVLQTLLGPGPYDEWLTAELEAARKLNRGVNGTSLAKKLQRENPAYQSSMSRNRLLGLADAIDIVDDYFVRYGLNSVLGPYPLGGIVIVVLAEAMLSLPVLWAVHFALNSLFFGRLVSGTPFVCFFLLFLAERAWKNWRKLRSAKRWSSYDAARDRLPITL